jgi:hypothetical protein
MLTTLLGVLGVVGLAGFAWFVWPPLVLLVAGVALLVAAHEASR